ncbi:MAG TPA: YihY/virulence factor BrkB family protein [Polyangiaceae bacterium]|nr:YihY/virulence factor BrkB family protein [Polyangiaceae bacterium]
MLERIQLGKGWAHCRRWLGSAWELTNQTLDGFSKDRGDLLAAALAYYTLLSIAPLIIIAVALAGMVLGEGTARLEVGRLLSQAMGPAAASAVEGWVDQAAAGGRLASVIGLGLVLFGASQLGAQLRNALNQIWNVEVTSSQGLRLVVVDYLRRRAFSCLVVLASGPVLLAVFASRALLTGFSRYLFADSGWAVAVAHGSQLLFSVASVALISAGVFRFVPDLRVSMRAAWYGGLLTSLLFNVGNVLVGIYLGRAGVSATYGAAGSAVVLLLWLQFSGYMFLLGAEFTQRLHNRFSGSAPDPLDRAPRPPSGSRSTQLAPQNLADVGLR